MNIAMQNLKQIENEKLEAQRKILVDAARRAVAGEDLPPEELTEVLQTLTEMNKNVVDYQKLIANLARVDSWLDVLADEPAAIEEFQRVEQLRADLAKTHQTEWESLRKKHERESNEFQAEYSSVSRALDRCRDARTSLVTIVGAGPIGPEEIRLTNAIETLRHDSVSQQLPEENRKLAAGRLIDAERQLSALQVSRASDIIFRKFLEGGIR